VQLAGAEPLRAAALEKFRSEVAPLLADLPSAQTAPAAAAGPVVAGPVAAGPLAASRFTDGMIAGGPLSIGPPAADAPANSALGFTSIIGDSRSFYGDFRSPFAIN
jgi:hypothetical protein